MVSEVRFKQDPLNGSEAEQELVPTEPAEFTTSLLTLAFEKYLEDRLWMILKEIQDHGKMAANLIQFGPKQNYKERRVFPAAKSSVSVVGLRYWQAASLWLEGAGREGEVDMLKELQLSLSVILLLACVFFYQLTLKSTCLFSCLPPYKSQQGLEALLSHGRSIVFLETSERMEPSPLVSCAVESAAKIYPEQPVVLFMKGLNNSAQLPTNSTYRALSLLVAIDNVFLFPLDMERLFEDTPLLSWYSQALSQLLCLLPWPWGHPPMVVSPGLPLPMQSLTTTAEGLSGSVFGTFTFPTFKFQSHCESIDWRRISALDVDRVAREVDVAILQELLNGVTFCNLDREVCICCGQPVDPALLKVLRLTQLIIEYLLHCQDCLSASVIHLEARLQASLEQQDRGQQELARQADELKGVRQESHQRRKLIGTLQQLLLQTGAYSYHPCHLCDKTFTNAAYLQGHIQRRHAGTAEGVSKMSSTAVCFPIKRFTCFVSTL
ncbi:Zinc finger protein DZIP1L [Manis javanica]|nr:Zinc finger protein DZIP1L [Manis javanica]